jgi:hypothetical protein
MAKIDRESYFDLPVSDQADVLQSLAPVMGRRAEILLSSQNRPDLHAGMASCLNYRVHFPT